MARTAAISGKGTTLHTAPDSTGAPGSYTKVGELRSVGQPQISSGRADATHYESDSSTIERISTGWKDGSDIPFEINYVKAQVNTLRGLVGLDKWFKITYPDGSTDIFYGSITSLGGDTVDNKNTITTKGTINPGGPITFTPAA